MKFKSIQAKLFVSYSSLILIIIVVFILSFYFTTSRILEQKASESAGQLALNLSDKLDAALRNMDSIAERVISSEQVKQLFFSDPSGTEATELRTKWDISSLLFSITGTPFQFYQMNLFGDNGRFVKFGKEYDLYAIQPGILAEKEWVKQALLRDGKKSIALPRRNDWDESGLTVISLSRAFAEIFGARVDSIVEIQQDYGVFVKLIERSVQPPGQAASGKIQAYVYDSAGNLVYPYRPESGFATAQSDYYWDTLKRNAGLHDTVRMKSFASKGNDILAFSRSEFTGWTVVLAQSEATLLQPVQSFRDRLLLIGVAILFVTMLLTFFVSKGLTIPIKRIRKSIRILSLETLEPKLQPAANLNELEELNESFVEMCARLKESLDEVVSARSHEIQARMLALQAQMNPHFLYNTLSTMSIKAEKNGQHEIVGMCQNLSDMLRYITVESSKPVELSQEMDYLRQYLALMKIRYADQFAYRIDVPDDMNGIKVPRLIVQPIVENCFKHAFRGRPPWHIDITGKRSVYGWEIIIRDNGMGFDEHALQQLECKIKNNDFRFAEDAGTSHGIGLLNIYYRLKLLYNERAIFSVTRAEDQGTIVTIGGSVMMEDNSNG